MFFCFKSLRRSFDDLRSLWNDITLAPIPLRHIEEEIEAIFALSFTWGAVVDVFPWLETDNILNDIFGLDVKKEFESDAQKYLSNSRQIKEADNWPTYLFFCILRLVFVVQDTVDGNDGQTTAMIGFGSIVGLLYTFFQITKSINLKRENILLDFKWDGTPGRPLNFWD